MRRQSVMLIPHQEGLQPTTLATTSKDMLSSSFNSFSDNLTIEWTLTSLQLKNGLDGLEGNRSAYLLASDMASTDASSSFSKQSWRIELTTSQLTSGHSPSSASSNTTSSEANISLFIRKIGPFPVTVAFQIAIYDCRHRKVLSLTNQDWVTFIGSTTKFGWLDILSKSKLSEWSREEEKETGSSSDGTNRLSTTDQLTIRCDITFKESSLSEPIEVLIRMSRDLANIFKDKNFLNVTPRLRSLVSRRADSRYVKRILHRQSLVLSGLFRVKSSEVIGSGLDEAIPPSIFCLSRGQSDLLQTWDNLLSYLTIGHFNSLINCASVCRLFVYGKNYGLEELTTLTERMMADMTTTNSVMSVLVVSTFHRARLASKRVIDVISQYFDDNESSKLVEVSQLEELPNGRVVIRLYSEVVEKVIRRVNRRRVYATRSRRESDI